MKHIRKSPLQTSPPPPVASNRLELEPLDHPSMTTLDLSQASSAGGGVSMGGSSTDGGHQTGPGTVRRIEVRPSPRPASPMAKPNTPGGTKG